MDKIIFHIKAELGIDLYKIECADFNFAPTPEALKKAAKFMNDIIEGLFRKIRIFTKKIINFIKLRVKVR